MRRTLALLATVALLALSVAAYGSPPTNGGEAKFEKTTITQSATADTSAVAYTSDAEARTCVYAETLNESAAVSPAVYRYTVETRRSLSPPARFDKAREGNGLSLTDFKYNHVAAGAAGFVRRI